jgi:multiple RNA-binding domain-containing protein 1
MAAYEALDKKPFQGRLLHISAAVDRKAKFEVSEGDGKKKGLKDEKNAKRKTMASKEFNWSMLYMNVCTFYFRRQLSYGVSDPPLCRATL